MQKILNLFVFLALTTSSFAFADTIKAVEPLVDASEIWYWGAGDHHDSGNWIVVGIRSVIVNGKTVLEREANYDRETLVAKINAKGDWVFASNRGLWANGKKLLSSDRVSKNPTLSLTESGVWMVVSAQGAYRGQL